MESKTLHDDAIAMVFLRNEFYKKKFYTVLGLFSLSIIGILILIGMLLYLVKRPPHPLYFVADPVGRLIEDIPLQEPNMTIDQVTSWMINAVQEANSYDFMNYRSELQNAQKYFTGYGWRTYMNGLKTSNNLVALAQRKYIVIAKVVQPPKLIAQGHMGAYYAYKFKLPLLVMYWEPPYDDQSKFYNPLVLDVILTRQSLLSSYQGLGIAQMNAEFVTTGGTQNGQ